MADGVPRGAACPTALVIDKNPQTRANLCALLRQWPIDATGVSELAAGLPDMGESGPDFILVAPNAIGTGACVDPAIAALAAARGSYLVVVADDCGDTAPPACVDDVLPTAPKRQDVAQCLRTGARTIHLREELRDRTNSLMEANRQLDAAHARLNAAHDAAARLQKGLIPPVRIDAGPFQVGAFHHAPSGISGDVVSAALHASERLSLHVVTLSGVGISTLVKAMELGDVLSAHRGTADPASPEAQAGQLNAFLWDDVENDRIATGLFAELDSRTGMFGFCQAGAAPPILFRKSGAVDVIGTADPILGVMGTSHYRVQIEQTEPGDLILILSNGFERILNITDPSADRQTLGDMLHRSADVPVSDLLEVFCREALRRGGRSAIAKDASALLVRVPERG